MTQFRYVASRPDGVLVRGTLEGRHGEAVVRTLADRRLLALDVREEGERRTARPLPPRACAVFLRGLSSLLDAGIPLDRALGTVRAGPRLTPIIREVQRTVREGASLSGAVGVQPGMPPLAVSLIRAGERSGLASSCRQAAEQLEREAQVAHRVRAALTYPALLVLVGGAAIGVLVGVVLPRFVSLLGDLGADLPWTTRMLLEGSELLSGAWLWVALVTLAAVALLGSWLRSAAGHAALLAIPLVGSTRLQFASARMGRALAALLDTGVPTLEALRAAGDAAGDLALKARVAAAAERVRGGASLGAALTAERAADAQVLDLLAAGEGSGRLPQLLSHAADLTDAEATRRLDAAVRLLEPGLIILLGGLVAFVALALLQAVYGLRVGP